MANFRKIARRSFLVGSATIAGGVAFGVYSVAKPVKNPLLAEQTGDEVVFNPYVKIDASGITLITPRADIGQGGYSVQALLIAEELDVDLEQVTVNPGPPSAAYWNSAFAPEAAEFLVGANEGRAYVAAETSVNAAMKLIGMQGTGGSTTAKDGYVKLRQAGAAAREALKERAASLVNVEVNTLKTKSGAVILPDGTSMPYTDLVKDAPSFNVPQDVALRDPSEWKLIGKALQRVDIPPKSTGAPIYGIDQMVEGMVYAAVKLSPAVGAAPNGFDASAAKAMRGVKDVVEISGGIAVVADNSWRAMKAAEAVEVEWGEAPFPPNMDAHWQALTDSFNEDNRNSRKTDVGDVDSVLADAQVYEAEYRAPYLAHAPLEPLNAIVLINDDRAEVWTGTQMPRFVQNNVAKIAGIKPEAVTLHATYSGGSFGHRLEDEVVKQCAEIAVTMKGTPVKLTYSREEDFTHDFPRPIGMARLRGSVKDGQVETFDLSIAAPNVMTSQMSRQGLNLGGPDSQLVAGAWAEPFDIPNRRVTGYSAPMLAPISSWRSVGASIGGFFYNTALDELIHEAGADPLEERLRLCNDDLSRQVLEKLGEISSWQGPTLGPNQGRGLAFTRSFGTRVGEIVDVTMTPDGIRIDAVYLVAEVGKVLDPIAFENQAMGGVIWGLGHAMNCEITFQDGIVEQKNYYDFEGMRLYQTPKITALGLENGHEIFGIGEPPVPPAAPALGNAIFAATGQRMREMPFHKFIDFV